MERSAPAGVTFDDRPILNRHLNLNESDLSDLDSPPFSRSLMTTVKDMSNLNHELESAVEQGDHERMKALLDHGANPNNYHSNRRETLLMSACFHCDALAVSLLLNAQADPNQTMPGKNAETRVTPLMIAAENGMAETVTELLHFNANPHARNTNGETALLAAARTNNHDAFAALVGSMVSATAP